MRGKRARTDIAAPAARRNLFGILDHLDAAVEMLDAARAMRKTHRVKVEQAVLRGSGAGMLDLLLERGGADPENLGREAGILADLDEHAVTELRQLHQAIEEAAVACLDGRCRRQATRTA